MQLLFPGEAFAVYPLMLEDPELDGATQLTLIFPFPGTAVTPVGAPGVVGSIKAPEAVDAELVPAPLVAVTVNV